MWAAEEGGGCGGTPLGESLQSDLRISQHRISIMQSADLFAFLLIFKSGDISRIP